MQNEAKNQSGFSLFMGAAIDTALIFAAMYFITQIIISL